MPTAFATAVDRLFADANLAEDADYTPDGEEPTASVRVILTHSEPNATTLLTDAIVSGLLIDVRTSDVTEQPPEGAVFELESGRSFRVRTSRRDELALVWECDVDEIDEP